MKLTIALLGLLPSAYAMCPDACSGHGACGKDDTCACYANWQGNNCGYKTCAYTSAWSDTKDATVAGREPHYYTECGNRGTCNRDSGLCECNDGYEGKGCARLSCLEGCSGHGTCETMLTQNAGYTGWDSEKILHCKCDPGYEGSDCSQRMCMLGDDPMSMRTPDGSSAQTAEVQTLELDGSTAAWPTGSFVLEYTDWRGEKWQTYPISGDTVNPIVIEEALEALPNYAIPDCTVTTATGHDEANFVSKFAITFVNSANSGDQINLSPIQNWDSNSAGGCDIDGCQPRFVKLAPAPTTLSVTETTKGTTEKLVCSGRGECNGDDGLCECYEGYFGQACEGQTIIM